ncbi:MAG TPA: cellulose biosynthesis cyclic di-GMP-binding regulatory protein BcsB, partial [Myxococcota bacterium]|nr:cellulose biosynthesis cyclic di-GMP-binding regulatory protein BcsB [Myxococcota bacterium]
CRGTGPSNSTRPSMAPGGPAHDGTPATGTFYAEFQRDLYQTEPLMLYGIMAERYIPFYIPKSWKLTGPVEVELHIDHSETLLPRRSAITVMVNNRAIASQFLDETNVRDGRIRALVDPAFLSDFNQIRVAVVQHYTNDCEDPFDPNLWTRISHDSLLKIPYARKPIEKDIVQLPAPLFEEGSIGPIHLDLVTGATVDAATIEALGILGFSFGRLSDYRGLQIDHVSSSLGDVKRHALLVGLVNEQSQIRQLIGGAEPAPGEGLVTLVPNPNDPTLGVLVVTAKDEEGLRKAAYAVAGDDRYEVQSGPSSTVRNLKESYPKTRRDPLPAPGTTQFTLAELGIEDRTVRGFYADPVVIPLMLEGDAAVRPGGGEFRLDFGYSSQLDNRLSTVEVSIDGVVLISRPLDRQEGEELAQLRVHLPAELVRPFSKIFVQFHLFPESFDACERVSDRIVWGTVRATSLFTLERDHYADMPDLGRLRYDLWPFTGATTSDAVTIIAPDKPAPDDAAAVFQTAAALGWRRTNDAPHFHATTGARAGASIPAEHLILLVAGDSPNTTYSALEQSGYLNRSQAGGAWQLTGAAGPSVEARFTETYGSLEEVQSPTKKDLSILVMRSATRANLLPLAETLSNDKALRKTDGNITVVPTMAEAEYRVVKDATLQQVGERPLNTRVTVVLTKFWPFFGLLLLGAALLFALSINLWGRRNGAHT